MADILNELFSDNNTSKIHSYKSKNIRSDKIESFDSRKYQALIYTDFVAQGICFRKITVVLNFDLPAFL